MPLNSCYLLVARHLLRRCYRLVITGMLVRALDLGAAGFPKHGWGMGDSDLREREGRAGVRVARYLI